MLNCMISSESATVSQAGDGLVVFGVEVVAAGEYCADCLQGFDVQIGRAGLEDDAAGSRWSSSRRTMSKGMKAFSLSGPLLEESWILGRGRR